MAFSIALRTSEPGLAPSILLAAGAASVAALPSRSVWPITVSVTRDAHADLTVGVTHGVGAQHQPREVDRPLVQLGVYGQLM